MHIKGDVSEGVCMTKKNSWFYILMIFMLCVVSCSKQRGELEVLEERAVADFAVSSSKRMMKASVPAVNSVYTESASLTETIQANQDRKSVV